MSQLSTLLRRLAIAFTFLVPLGLSEVSSAASRVFYDGFESGNTNLWGAESGRNRCTVVTSAADGVQGPYAGSRMAQCNWNGSAVWNSAEAFETLVANPPPYASETFYRARIRIDQNTERTDTSPLKFLRIYSGSTGTSDYRDIYENSTSAPGLSNRGDAGPTQLTTYWGTASGDNTGSTSSWHKIEYYFNHSTNNIKVWHDGVLIRNNTVSFNSQKWLPFYLASNWSDAHDSTNHVYFDEIEIFSDNGTGASGSMSDATISSGGGGPTIPNAPSNATLTIN